MKLYKTTIQYTIWTEEPFPTDWEMAEIDRECVDGSFYGAWSIVDSQEVDTANDDGGPGEFFWDEDGDTIETAEEKAEANAICKIAERWLNGLELAPDAVEYMGGHIVGFSWNDIFVEDFEGWIKPYLPEGATLVLCQKIKFSGGGYVTIRFSDTLWKELFGE